MRKAAFALCLLALASMATISEAQAPMPPAPEWPNEEPREIKAKSDLLDFVYSWPLEALSIRELDAHFEAEAAKARTQAIATAREARSEGGKGRFPRHESRTIWKVVSDNSRLLSLVADVDIFVGGAERGSLYDAMLWDRQLARAIEVGDLFENADSAFSTMHPLYCREFSRQRVERGGDPVDSDECRPIEDLIIAPVEPNGGYGYIDRFRVLMDPYAAGSSTAGRYEIDVPVTDALRRLVKPEFQVFFASADQPQ